MMKDARFWYNLLTILFAGLTVLVGIAILALAAGAIPPPGFMAQSDSIPPTVFHPVAAAAIDHEEPLPSAGEPAAQAEEAVSPLDSEPERVVVPSNDGTTAAAVEDDIRIVPAPVEMQPQTAASDAAAPAGEVIDESRASVPVAVVVPNQLIELHTEPPAAAEPAPDVPDAPVEQPAVSFEGGVSLSVDAPTTPLPDGSSPARTAQSGPQPSPLRVMVPSDSTVRALRQRGVNSITELFPSLDPARSFSPGPKMELPFGKDTSSTQQPSGPVQAPSLAAPPPVFKTLAILVEFTDQPCAGCPQTSLTICCLILPAITSRCGASTGKLPTANWILSRLTANQPSALGWQRAPQTYAYYVSGNYCDRG